MKRKTILNFLCVFALMFAMACAVITPGPDGTATQTIPPPTATPGTVSTDEGSPMPAQSPQLQFIAYVHDGQLLVTDVTNGVQGGTTQYTMAGESDQVSDLVWSPSGPQMSIIGLPEGRGEWTIIPGFFYGISLYRTGTWIAAAHYKDGFQDMNPTIELYSAQAGQLILSLGPGNTPQFQP